MQFLIVLAVMLLDQKHYACQWRQFITAAVICVDKTLWSLNILNSNEHAYAAQPIRQGKRVGCKKNWLINELTN